MSELANPKDLIEVTLPGETVCIRQLSPENAQRYFELMAADRTHFSKYDDGVTDRYKTVDDVRERMEHPKPNRYSFGIWDGDTMVGSINLEEHENGTAEVGYWVGTDYTGKGYATRALNALIVFGFEHLGKKELQASVLVGNEDSRKPLEKTGFVQTGEEDGYWLFKKERESHGH